MEENKDHASQRTYRYFLEGIPEGTTTENVYNALTRRIFHDDAFFKMTQLATQGYEITTPLRIKGGKLPLFPQHPDSYLIVGTHHDENYETPELTMFHKDPSLTLTDLIAAQIPGVIKIRKWKPSRATGKPNRGYSITFYNASAKALAFSENPWFIRGSNISLKVPLPFGKAC